ncbi:MAG: nucleotide-binding protein, partial [Candidatus Cloacimonetes bacterium]|nr:nucleotide-binding protein [Candidatus Cloacimonadota bacterium]
GGKYEISETAETMLDSEKANPKLSFALRKLYNKGEKNIIDSKNINDFIEKVNYPEAISQKVDSLLLYIYENDNINESGFKLNSNTIYRFGIKNRNEMLKVIRYGEGKKYFTVEPKLGDGGGFVKLSANGFDRAENLISNTKSKEEVMKNGIKLTETCFLVHGHNKSLKFEVARFIEKELKIEVIILHEQAGKSRSLIKKFEDHSNVDFAVCLYTQDDLGSIKKENIKVNDLNFRARQNVIFEAGYLMGKLGRDKVFILLENEVKEPSDLKGINYISLDNWREELRKEIKEVYKCD